MIIRIGRFLDGNWQSPLNQNNGDPIALCPILTNGLPFSSKFNLAKVYIGFLPCQANLKNFSLLSDEENRELSLKQIHRIPHRQKNA